MERSITLTLTENCNLSCIYCYEEHRAGRKMWYDTACSILDQEFSQLTAGDFLTIDFFGGEPFLEFELIKQIVSHVEERDTSGTYVTPYRFFATTNGTLIHGDIQEWLKRRRNFFLGLSLDGTKQMHDLNRSGSFEKIDLDFFVAQYPNQPIKMTISEQTLPSLAEGVIYAHEKGFDIACNLAYGLDWSTPRHKKQLGEQLELLIEFYLRHPSLKRASILDREISYIGYAGAPEEETIGKWCGAGTAMRTYDVDGKLYPCQFFMPMSCGEEKAANAHAIRFKDRIHVMDIEAKCRECVVKTMCPTCYGSNYAATGDIYKKDDGLCILEKIIFYANACFLLRAWGAGHLSWMAADRLSASIFAAKRIIESLEAEVNP